MTTDTVARFLAELTGEVEARYNLAAVVTPCAAGVLVPTAEAGRFAVWTITGTGAGDTLDVLVGHVYRFPGGRRWAAFGAYSADLGDFRSRRAAVEALLPVEA